MTTSMEDVLYHVWRMKMSFLCLTSFVSFVGPQEDPQDTSCAKKMRLDVPIYFDGNRLNAENISAPPCYCRLSR